MRADRLVATLLLLQARGKVTAREVADELEVSERTARRDLDALGVAGIPVFSRQGRGGGWELIGDSRTDLTGLRSAEARALLTMAAATGRGTPEFTSAIRKLVQALPEPVRVEAQRAMSSVVSDDTAWGNRAGSLLVEPRREEWIEPLQRAVIEQRRATLTYDTPRKGISQRTIEALGLVIKQGNWYLLAMTEQGQRSFRVDRIVDVALDERTFERPAEFDLEAAWSEITTGYEHRSNRVTVEAIVDDRTIPALRALGVETVIHGAVEIVGDEVPGEPGAIDDRSVRCDADRWRDISPQERAGSSMGLPDRSYATLGAWNVGVLAAEIAGVIDGIELIDPPMELATRLAAIGERLVSRFAHDDQR